MNGGTALGQVTASKDVRQVQAGLNQLDNNLDALNKKVDILVEKLRPILTLSPPEIAKESPTETLCPIADAIRAKRFFVDSIIDKICKLNTEVEL